MQPRATTRDRCRKPARPCSPNAIRRHLEPGAPLVEPLLVAELTEIDGDTEVVDATFPRKQPDWTYNETSSGDETYSGKTPVELVTDHRERAET